MSQDIAIPVQRQVFCQHNIIIIIIVINIIVINIIVINIIIVIITSIITTEYDLTLKHNSHPTLLYC